MFTLCLVALWAAAALPQTEILDLTMWQEGYMLPGNWSQVGLCQYVVDPLRGAAYFDSAGDVVISPLYSEPIVSVTVESAARSQSEFTRELSLLPSSSDGKIGTGIPLARPTNTVYMTESLRLEGLDAVRFKIVSVGGKGNWAIRRIIVVYGQDEPVVQPDPFWKASEFLPEPGSRLLDLSSFRWVTQESSWENGADGDGIYAFANDAPVTKIRPAKSGSETGGLYCANVDLEDQNQRSIALLGSGSTDVKLILPILLDTEKEVTVLTVSYEAGTVKKGTSITRLSFSWGSCRHLDEMTDSSVQWNAVEAGTYVAGDADGLKCVSLSARRVSGGGFILLKWSVPKQTHSSMVSVSNIRVSGELRDKQGMTVILR